MNSTTVPPVENPNAADAVAMGSGTASEPSQTKCMILTSQRSGSVFLQKYLNSHPDICCHGEILLGLGGPCGSVPPRFLDRNRRARLAWAWLFSGAAFFPERVVERTLDSSPESAAIAFRGMYNQLRSARLVSHLQSIQGLRVIHLMRDNLLRQYVSRKQMHHRYAIHGRGSAHSSKPLQLSAIRIDPAAALKSMRDHVNSRDSLHAAFESAGCPMLPLHYEQLLATGSVTDADHAALCDFLGVENAPMSSDLVKMNHSPMDELVENFDDLRSVILDSEFASMLDQ